MTAERTPLSVIGRIRLAARIWFWYWAIRLRLRGTRLPELVGWLGRPLERSRTPMEPRRLGRAVGRVLGRGPFRTRCLLSSLVLFRLLREQGAQPELVIGLPPRPESHEAHAWVEVDGRVVGPPPGRLGHSALTRYGCDPRLGPQSAPARLGIR